MTPTPKTPRRPTPSAKAAEAPAERPKQPRQAEHPAGAKKAPKPKARLVRDSFTMPQEDHALIAALKNRALLFKRPTKKSELLRAGLHALQALPAASLREALDALTPLKVGRPRRSDS